jgi:hypothetical protein
MGQVARDGFAYGLLDIKGGQMRNMGLLVYRKLARRASTEYGSFRSSEITKTGLDRFVAEKTSAFDVELD